MKISSSFHPYAIVTIIFWSLAYVLTRLTLVYFSPLPLAFLRCLVASVALGTVLMIRRASLIHLRDLGWVFMSGALGYGLYLLAFNTGSITVNASTGSVILAMVPVITALRGGLSVNTGILWLLLAALLLSGYNLLQRRLTRQYPALTVTSCSIFLGTLQLSLFAPQAVREVAAAPPVQWLYIALLGILCMALAQAAWTKAISIAEHTSSVSNYMFVTPFLTTLLGLVLANETPDLSTLVGGVVILLGMTLFYFGGRIKRLH